MIADIHGFLQALLRKHQRDSAVDHKLRPAVVPAKHFFAVQFQRNGIVRKSGQGKPFLSPCIHGPHHAVQNRSGRGVQVSASEYFRRQPGFLQVPHQKDRSLPLQNVQISICRLTYCLYLVSSENIGKGKPRKNVMFPHALQEFPDSVRFQKQAGRQIDTLQLFFPRKTLRLFLGFYRRPNRQTPVFILLIRGRGISRSTGSLSLFPSAAAFI